MFKSSWLRVTKRIMINFSFILSLVHLNVSQAASGDVFEESRQECFSILKAQRTFYEDSLAWAQNSLDRLPTFSEAELVHLLGVSPSPRTVTKMQEDAHRLFTGVVNTVTQNLTTSARAAKILEDLTPLTLPQIVQTFLASASQGIEARGQNARIPSTLPSDMSRLPPFDRRIAEDAVRIRAHEAVIIKTLCTALPDDHIDRIFESIMYPSVAEGHFLVLRAYVFGLIESPPIPHHYRYRLSTYLLENRQNPAMTTPALRAERKKALQISRQRLAQPDVQALGRLEEEAREKLDQYRKGDIIRNQLKIDAAVDQTINHLLDDIIMSDESEETYLSILKKKEKKQRIKEARNLRKQHEREESEKNFQEERPPQDELLPLATSASEKKPDDTLAMSSPPAPEVSAGALLSKPEKPVEHTPSFVPDAIFVSLPPAPTGEEFRYQPFVRDEPEGAAAAAAAAIAVPSLKPRLYALWEEFWTAPWMEWADFTKLFMNETLGFGIKPTDGSFRHVIYPRKTPSTTGKKYFVVHEPHGDRTTLGPGTLRDIREHLARDFGWSLESFQGEK